jgi:alkylated DNA repair dioxygenase AlkB
MLVNYYASQDSISFHSDDEASLPLQLCITSLSLGGTREFRVRHTAYKDSKLNLNCSSRHSSSKSAG